MSDVIELKQRNQRIFILVSLNFSMLFILFCAMGYVIWQSASLVQNVNAKLEKVEQAVVVMRSKINEINPETVVDAAMDRAIGKIETTLSSSLQESALLAPMKNLSTKVQGMQVRLEKVGETIHTTSEHLQTFDTGLLAQQVSYELLKGLGEGFNQAAETRKPETTLMKD